MPNLDASLRVLALSLDIPEGEAGRPGGCPAARPPGAGCGKQRRTGAGRPQIGPGVSLSCPECERIVIQTSESRRALEGQQQGLQSA